MKGKKTTKKSIGIKRMRLLNKDTRGYLLIDLTPNTLDVVERYDPIEIENKIKEDCKISIRKLLNRQCYFCGFSEVVEKHHIVGVKSGGKKLTNNILPLCPNHHYLLHRVPEYELVYSQEWFFIMNNKTKKIIPPHINQQIIRRKCPIGIKKFMLIDDKLREVDNTKENDW